MYRAKSVSFRHFFSEEFRVFPPKKNASKLVVVTFIARAHATNARNKSKQNERVVIISWGTPEIVFIKLAFNVF